METCKYCNLEYKSVKNHDIYCKHNPDRLDRSGINHPKYGKKGRNKISKAKDLCIEYIPSDKEIEGRIKASIIKNERRWANPNAREKQSKAIKEAIKRNPAAYSSSNISGRAKLYDVIDSFNNPTKVKGTWELLDE